MPSQRKSFYAALKARRHQFAPRELVRQFRLVSRERVDGIARQLAEYISVHLPAAFDKREALTDYRTNPYVLMTTTSVMDLADPTRFADFLFNTKLYMALETSFGKSLEKIFLSQYPINSRRKWGPPPEKRAEFALLEGLSREQRAARRTASVWREIDASVVLRRRRYLVTVKSGPSTINDTQAQAMTNAIIDYHPRWAERSRALSSGLRGVDVVLGLTYGTDRTTNNKENQILAKLLEHGFAEEDRAKHPGVLTDSATRNVRIYRKIGRDFWAFVGNPANPRAASFVFLEVLLALAKALSAGLKTAGMEERINQRIATLSSALSQLHFPRDSLPEWIGADFSEEQLFWFATAMTAFYDEGI